MLTNKYPQLEEMQSYITAAIQNVTESRWFRDLSVFFFQFLSKILLCVWFRKFSLIHMKNLSIYLNAYRPLIMFLIQYHFY
jgi:hypothetical protein